MNRLGRKFVTSTEDSDDEELLYERQTLISDDELCDNGSQRNPFDIRQRQSLDRRKNSQIGAHEMIDLRKPKERTGESGGGDFTYYEIKPGDTLQSICLRYACPVVQVKRLNGLINDQEFYGLRKLKLPLGKFGLLEDILNQNHSYSLNNTNHDSNSSSLRKTMNSPGSALSISTPPTRIKPLLNPGYSSDRIKDLGRSVLDNNTVDNHGPNQGATLVSQHSFSSLRDFAGNDMIDMRSGDPRPNFLNNSRRYENFIKSDINEQSGRITVDNLLTDSDPVINNIFEDLDYHVEMAKAAAETRDQRVNALVDTMAINDPTNNTNSVHPATRVSKIPELFFSGENFGLNFKKLIIIIFVVCLFVPLVYINQTNHVVTMQL